MTNKKEARQRRARKTRAKIAEQKTVRLAISRTNQHIYAQLKVPASPRLRLIVQVTDIMVALKRWLKPRANMACSSKLR
jgi:ribosomal protein L18